MTRSEVLERLTSERRRFDQQLAAVPAGVFDVPVPGATHSPKQIVAHVAAYDALIVERLQAARRGETTSFDRDRVGWESFNKRIWAEAATRAADDVLADAGRVFAALIAEVGLLTDEELAGASGVSAVLDPAWLEGRPLWELIAIDAFDHYPMHVPQLAAAAVATPAPTADA